MSTETMRKRTKVCCLDLDKDVIEYLNKRFDVYNGSLGKPINVAKYNQHGLNLLLNFDFPENLHEYEVFIEDMKKGIPQEYKKEDHIRNVITGNYAYYFRSYYPQTIFNPTPFSCALLKEKIYKERQRAAIKIVFQGCFEEIDYAIGEVHQYSDEHETHNNYEHLHNFRSNQLYGTEVRLCENKVSKTLFEAFLNDIEYCDTYWHPTIWKDNKEVYDEHFIPLLETKGGSIVSYLWATDNDITIMLPQTKRKIEMLQVVFHEILYKYFSEYFPEVAESAWINNLSCLLPNQFSLLQEKTKLEDKYKEDLANIERRIQDNNNKYGYLHVLLTGTDDELVSAVITFLKWLGFENVIDKDKYLDKDFNEEDIQIEVPNGGLLLLEVKGINGTSTDAQCSQISKVVHRRSREQKRFDVHGLYVVNNEKNIAPEKRTTPPFNEQQIKDAEYDERGLCYTWRLFNLFFEIEEGIIRKEDARNALFANGLIDFRPLVVEVGNPYKYYCQHTIVCVEIKEHVVNVGDYFYYNDGIRWKKVKILSIQQEMKNVESATNGRFGFKLEQRVPEGETLYIINN